jgi:hypothetical protein
VDAHVQRGDRTAQSRFELELCDRVFELRKGTEALRLLAGRAARLKNSKKSEEEQAMNSLNENRHIERQRFFNGQRLFDSDLQGLETFNREMRWLHNKSLHQPGIGAGFAVVGKRGDREVTIRPGYAIDAEGREIVLTQTRVEPVPPVAGDEGRPVLFDLTVSYPDDAKLEEAESREGVCGSRGVVRLREEPIFCWVRLNEDKQADDDQSQGEIRDRMKIVLARAEVFNCQLNKDLSIAERLNARPPRQPYVCCGKDDSPEWEPWELAQFNPVEFLGTDDGKKLFAAISQGAIFTPFILPMGLMATIDTSECGFLTTPCYSARIEGDRVREQRFVLDGLVQIVDPQPTRFTINVLLVIQPLLTQPEVVPTVKRGRPAEAPSGVAASVSSAIGGFAERAAAADFDNQVGKLIAKYIADEWKVVWMGVEG